jgi:hypothetical protein
MTITIPPCGPHCGIASGREGHCDCGMCHDGAAPVVITRSDLLTVVPKASMCDQWYAGIGDYRPWHVHVEAACTCGKNSHYRPEHHGTACPVRRSRELNDYDAARNRWQGAEPGGAETWAP